jgi:aminoglycoside/choline kinase family phosphotransferase
VVSELINQTVSRFPDYARHRIEVAPLEKGGSDRFFYRVRVGEESSLILAKYGSQREENRHYVRIAQFLREIGVRVPEIYFHDEPQGLIWMEDLGDRDLWSFRNEPWPVRGPLYQRTLDQILTLHLHAHEAPAPEPWPFQPPFDAALYRWEQNYFLENCLGRHFGLAVEEVERRCDRSRLDEIAESLAARPRCFVHRDFQSQNIVVKNDEPCFIDFQGMRLGLPQYDLASLLYDPYVTLTEAERRESLAYYVGACENQSRPLDADFEEVFALCAAQRLMQALGAYGFLGHVKGRAHFLDHIPAAFASLRHVLAPIPGLDGLRAILAGLKRAG